jgi:hypothetical protein
MAKYVVVDKAPEVLKDGEFVIRPPDFMEEILENKTKAGRSGLTVPNHLRYVAGSIGLKYDQKLEQHVIRPHLFIGRRYKNDKELSDIIVEMMKLQYPSIFGSYVDYQIKHRPKNTKVIYFEGSIGTTDIPFQLNGIDKTTLEELAIENGTKQRKVVGKPAVTKEQAKELANSEEK